MARSTGFEPAISSVTGRRDNPFTTSAWCFSFQYDSSFAPGRQQGVPFIFVRGNAIMNQDQPVPL